MAISDQNLLARWIEKRDGEAFRALAERYGGMVYAVSLRVLGDPHASEDVAQECFELLAAVRRPPKGPLGPWLHRVVTRRALNRIRGDRRRSARETRYARMQPDSVGAVWDDIHAYVDEAVAKLPGKVRDAIVAHYFEGHSHGAIAAREGVSRAAITQRIQRGVSLVRDDLRRRGVVVPAATLAGMFETNLAGASIPPGLYAALGRIAVSGAAAPVAAASSLGIKILAATCAAAGAFAFWLNFTPERRPLETDSPRAEAIAQPTSEFATPMGAEPAVTEAVRSEAESVAEPAGPETALILTGRVYDKDTGIGVGGGRLVLTLRVDNPAGSSEMVRIAETACDGDGSYRFEAPRTGIYSVGFVDDKPPPPYANAGSQSRVDAESGDKEFVLDIPVLKGFQVAGTVIDFEGSPLPGARVNIAGSSGASVTQTLAGAQGEFSAYVPPYRTLDLKVSAHVILNTADLYKYLPVISKSEEIVLASVEPAGVTGLVLQVVEGGSITGRLLGPSREPLPGVRIGTVYSDAFHDMPINAVQSLEDGSFGFWVGAPGRHSLVASSGKNRTQVGEVDIGPREMIEGLEIRLPFISAAPAKIPKAPAIEGIAVNPDGHPLEHCHVSLYRKPDGLDKLETSESSVHTGPDGRFVLEPESDGLFAISAYHPNWGHGELLGIAPGATDLIVELPPQRKISMQVVKAADGEAVTKCAFFAITQYYESIRHAMRDDGTTFEPWFNSASNGAVLRHIEFQRNFFAIRTSEDGFYSVENADWGPVLVVCVAEGFAPGWTLVDVPRDGANIPLAVIRLKPESLIRGRVIGPNRRPLSYATVFLSDDPVSSRYFGTALSAVKTRADRNGHFEFRGLIEGPIYVAALLQGYEPASVLVTASSSTPAITIQLSPEQPE